MTQHLNVSPVEVEKLTALNNSANSGRGLQCVKTILASIARGDNNGARLVREWDGDKTRNYPRIEMQIYQMFGCRGHGVMNCKDWLCENLYKYMVDDYEKEINRS